MSKTKTLLTGHKAKGFINITMCGIDLFTEYSHKTARKTWRGVKCKRCLKSVHYKGKK